MKVTKSQHGVWIKVLLHILVTPLVAFGGVYILNKYDLALNNRGEPTTLLIGFVLFVLFGLLYHVVYVLQRSKNPILELFRNSTF